MWDFQALRHSATRYWERRRIIYNLALVPPAILGYLPGAGLSAALDDPHRLSTGAVVGLFLLSAIGANICYTFAYALEFFFIANAPDSRWSSWGRAAALIFGILFAMSLALIGGRNIAIMQYGFQ